MAIRYSGDVEVRMYYKRGRDTYEWTVRAPRGFRMRGNLPRANLRGIMSLTRKFDGPDSSASYDEVARSVLNVARRWAAVRSGRRLPVAWEDNGQILVRRTFQAPCPVLR